MEQVTGVWAGGGGLEIVPVGKSEATLDLNVVRCRYAELYKQLGLTEPGYLFHCSRDFGMAEGYSGSLTLRRTQTIMRGADHRDFRFSRKA